MVDTGVLLDRAGLLLAQGRIRDAEDAAREVLSQEPYNDMALSLLGRCAYEGGHFADGMGFIREAVAIRPENSFYYYLLAFGHYQLDEHLDAADLLDTAIALHPETAEYYGLQAFVLLAQHAWEGALQKADEGLALEADNLTCLNARSRALNRLRRTDAAIATMQDALAVDPDNDLTHITVAWNYLEKGAHRDARHHFREALRINPNSESARTGLKEALKSNVAPYRWLLQYQFWLQHKGRRWQTAAPIILFVLFRLLSAALGASQGTKGLVWVPVSIYLLLVVTSWTIGPIANFVLLFNPLGKHALSVTERWSAVSVVSALGAGILLMLLALFAPGFSENEWGGVAFIAGLILFTLALPLGDLVFPLRWKGRSRREKAAMVVTALGLAAVISLLAMPGMFVLPALYGAVFFLYNWTGVLR